MLNFVWDELKWLIEWVKFMLSLMCELIELLRVKLDWLIFFICLK